MGVFVVVVEEEVGRTAVVEEKAVGYTAVEEEEVGRTAVAEAVAAAAAAEEEAGRTAVAAAVEEDLRVVEREPKRPKCLQTWLDAYQEVLEVVRPAP